MIFVKIISMTNNKGGVSKSTSCFNLAHALAMRNKKVLMIDNDPQSSLTVYHGLKPLKVKNTTFDVLTDKCDINEAIVKTTKELVHLLPSSIDLCIAERELMGYTARESILKEKLSMIKEDYDYVIIDNTPSLGILTINAIVACDYVIAPTEPSFLALKGLEILVNTIESVKKLNPNLDFMGVLVSLFDSRVKHHQEVLDALRSDYRVFDTIVKRSIKFSDSCLAKKSIMDFAGLDFAGSQSYIRFAEEVEDYVSKS
jgi:chromosome partitioning protein